MTTLLELINNLALSNDSPEDASPKPADMSSPPFTFDPNPSDMLDIPPPPSPNPFQPPGPDYGWGNESTYDILIDIASRLDWYLREIRRKYDERNN
ncbi:hypothetical protein JAAARDRAFT_201333 [Jaapia argillacea MUCL 33604]|uniref:Uncharacterized protein n=1 Tax=Jaapia argillacea MUCL 33604 TaxID=933084 RepID=A0A067P4Y7_9AGAM|nr:hypothetical protein JAAARDRAFT_201333 [Jaapia argillacea MUCL 33604]